MPLYLSIPHLSRTLKSTSPSLAIFKSALLNAGYAVSISHTNPLGIKTNAPLGFLWDIMKQWHQVHPIQHIEPYSVAARILAKPMRHLVDLSLHASAIADSKEKRLLRFQLPPCENWGPRAKAKS